MNLWMKESCERMKESCERMKESKERMKGIKGTNERNEWKEQMYEKIKRTKE